MALHPVIFLDFDGVTHPRLCASTELFSCLPRFEGVLQRYPRVDVVISSSWREFHRLHEMRQYFSPDFRERVVGCTPSAHLDHLEPAPPHVRESECLAWLEANRPCAPWLAIDDVSSFFTPHCSNLLLIDGDHGMSDSDATALETRLGIFSGTYEVTGHKANDSRREA